MLDRGRLLRIAAAIILNLAALAASAQNTTGTLVGHIADKSAAAIVGAQVTVTNVGTHQARATTSNASGDYAVVLLPPGTYEVSVTARGFKTASQTGVKLDVDQTIRSEFLLEVGAIAETVTVSTEQTALDTDSAAVSEVVGSTQIQALPLNGRNFQDLLFIAPGAVNNPGGEQTTYRIAITGGGDSSISIGGSRGSSEGYTVDGTTILEIGYDTPAFAPSLDDIAEFNALSKSYSAAYGFSVNQVNVVSKSGTNSLHGSAFEYLRNNYADALSHGFVKGSNVALLRRNQFGYSLGGPVRIPLLYNGKDKTFFFANYEGFRQKQDGGSSITSVPTANEMKGIFDASVLNSVGGMSASEAADRNAHNSPGCPNPVTYSAGSPRVLFNPFDPNGCPFPLVNGQYTIPAGMIHGLGNLLMRTNLYFPTAPNLSTSAPINNFAFASQNVVNFDQQNYRVDHSFTNKDTIMFHLVWHSENSGSTNPLPVNAVNQTQPARLYTATETHAFSPNLINSLRIGYMHSQSTVQPGLGISTADLNSLAFPLPIVAAGEGYPRIQIDTNPDNDGLTYGGGSSFFSGIRGFKDSVWDLGESLIWTVRRHTLSMGFSGRRNRMITNGNGVGLSRLNFDGLYSGDAFADALMGAVSGGGLSNQGPAYTPGLYAHIHFNTWAPYFQDDWRMTDRLTLNLGLRYEYSAVPIEEQNSFRWPDFQATGGAVYFANPKVVATYGGTNPLGPGGLYVSPPDGQRGPGTAPKNVLLPRLGFAYRLTSDNKTVLRGGFGKFSDTIEANEFQASTSGVYPASAGLTSGDAPLPAPGQWAPLWDAANLPVATVSGPVTSFYNDPNSVLGFMQIASDKYRVPYVLSWNLSVQRELPWGTKLEVDYVGNHGSNLFSRSNPNASTPCQPQYNCTVTAGVPSVAPALRTPFRNLGFLIFGGFDGFSNYNAGDVQLTHRGKSLDLVASYTWSKALDTKSAVAGFSGDNAGWAGPQDGHNISSDYARGNFDVGQRLAITAVYALPFGRGHKMLSGAPRVLDAVVNGWNLGVLASAQGGLPFTIIAADNGINNTFSERANFTPNNNPFKRSLHQWYNLSEFSQPAPGYFGNSSRDAVRAPGAFHCDLSLAKKIPVTERLGAELRFDAFNAFNHWNPGQPDSNIGSSTAGQIFPNNTQTGDYARILQISGRVTF